MPVSDLMNLYGSPLYIYSKSQIEFNWKVFEHSFGAHPHLICYAVKANSNLAVLNILPDGGFELLERAPGVTIEAIKSATKRILIVNSSEIPEMQL